MQKPEGSTKIYLSAHACYATQSLLREGVEWFPIRKAPHAFTDNPFDRSAKKCSEVTFQKNNKRNVFIIIKCCENNFRGKIKVLFSDVLVFYGEFLFIT